MVFLRVTYHFSSHKVIWPSHCWNISYWLMWKTLLWTLEIHLQGYLIQLSCLVILLKVNCHVVSRTILVLLPLRRYIHIIANVSSTNWYKNIYFLVDQYSYMFLGSTGLFGDIPAGGLLLYNWGNLIHQIFAVSGMSSFPPP